MTCPQECLHPGFVALPERDPRLDGADFCCAKCGRRWALADLPAHLKTPYNPQEGLKGLLQSVKLPLPFVKFAAPWRGGTVVTDGKTVIGDRNIDLEDGNYPISP